MPTCANSPCFSVRTHAACSLFSCLILIMAAVSSGCDNGAGAVGASPTSAGSRVEPQISTSRFQESTTTASRAKAVPAARAAAFTQLKSHLIDSKAIARDDDSSSPSRLVVTYDAAGATEGLWAFGPGGLGVTLDRSTVTNSQQESFDAAFRSFLGKYPALFASSQEGLSQPRLSVHKLASGKVLHHLEYRQVVDGIPVFNGEVAASFVDGILVSVNGAIEEPSAMRLAKAQLPAGGRPRASGLQNEAEGKTEQLAEEPELLWDHGGQRFIHQFKSGAWVRHVAPEDGTILYESDGRKHGYWAEVERTYRVSMLSDTDIWPYAGQDTDVPWWGAAYINPPSATFYHHSDYGYNYFAAPTYGYIYTGPADHLVTGSGTRTQPQRWGDFTESYSPTGGRTQAFASQHTVRWVQHAAQVIAQMPMASYITDWSPVAVVVGIPGEVSSAMPSCTGSGSWQISDAGDCIEIAPIMGPPDRPDVPGYGIIFHEYGHVADYRIKGFRPATCEIGALSEQIAHMVAASIFMWTWGIGTEFTDYDGHSEPAYNDPNVKHSIHGLTAGGNKVHGPNFWQSRCYVADCSAGGYYGGFGLTQAFWESAHGVNCGSGSCLSTNDGSTWGAAISALAYAMYNTGLNEGFQSFAANLLTYYYYYCGETIWGNRWWIFNHHRLVGPDYGYFQCNTD